MHLEELLRRVFVSPYTWLVPLTRPLEVRWISATPAMVEPGDVFLAEAQSPPQHWHQAIQRGARALILIGQQAPGRVPEGIPVVWVRTPHNLSTVYRHLLRALLQPSERLHPRTLFWMLTTGETGALGNLRLALEQLGLHPHHPYRVLRMSTRQPTAAVNTLRTHGATPPHGLVESIRPGEITALLAHDTLPDPVAWREVLDHLAHQDPHLAWSLTRPYPWDEWNQALQRAGLILEIVRRIPLLQGMSEDEAQPYLWMLERLPEQALQDLSQQVLGPMLQQPEAETLLLSLEALFLYPNLSRAANALYIHRNTLRQRLERIAQLTGYRYDNPHHRWWLQLAWFGYRWSQRDEDPTG